MRRGGEEEKEERMRQRLWFIGFIVVVLTCTLGVAPAPAAPPEGTLTVAVATFGNERWLPHQYVAAEDIVLKPMLENLLSRDLNTGSMSSMLAERWEVLDGGRIWKFHLRKGIHFHDGWGEVTAEDVKFTLAAIVQEGSANATAPWLRPLKSMEIAAPYTITLHFDKPVVTFDNRVNQGLFPAAAFIHSKKYIETVGEEAAERHPIGTGPWRFVEHVRGDRIVYEAVEKHWRTTPHFKRLVFLKVPEPATRMAMLRAGNADVIETGGEYVEELKKVGVRTLTMPDVGEAVATYWERVGLKVKRRPMDRAVFQADFRARTYAGVALAYAGPTIAPEPWELLLGGSHTRGTAQLLLEHPTLDALIDRLQAEPNYAERVRIMREELGPWLYEYMPAVSIGPTHSIVGVGPKVGDCTTGNTSAAPGSRFDQGGDLWKHRRQLNAPFGV